MVKHSLSVIKNAIETLNSPVIAFDQPLYALGKRIRWKWPEDYGKDRYSM